MHGKSVPGRECSMRTFWAAVSALNEGNGDRGFSVALILQRELKDAASSDLESILG